MNFLELAQRLRQECGGSGSGPASVTTATAEDRLWVDYTNQAYLELQELRPNWDWMWASTSIPVVAGTDVYALASPTIQRDSLRIDGSRLGYRGWREFQAVYGGAPKETRKPNIYTIRPDKNLVLNALPDADYTLAYEHYTLPELMAANTDIPKVPERYRMILVWSAMMAYGLYDNAPEVIQRGKAAYDQALALLSRDSLPEVELPGPLA